MKENAKVAKEAAKEKMSEAKKLLSQKFSGLFWESLDPTFVKYWDGDF